MKFDRPKWCHFFMKRLCVLYKPIERVRENSVSLFLVMVSGYVMPWNKSKYSGLQNTLLWRHNNDLRASVKNTHMLYDNNKTYCKFFLLPKSISWEVSSWLHQNLMKQSFPFFNALLPVLTTSCLTRGDIFEILSYQK